MSYAQPADFLKRYDARTTGDLVNDGGNRQSPAQLLSDQNLQAALDDAAGQINTACLFGQRYSVVNLQALTGVDQSVLFRLNCDLAFGYLNLRRGNDPKKFAAFEQALDLLELLRKGERIFNVPGDVAASLPSIRFPSAQAYATINLLRDSASRYFPTRDAQQPSGN